MKLYRLRSLCAALLACMVVSAAANCDSPAETEENAGFQVVESDEGLEIRKAGELVACYVTEGPKPILFPLVGPGGLEMTRGWPMREATVEEETDHPHHRSVWLAHGEVNGVDFWLEGEGRGTVETREIEQAEGGEQATIAATADWLSPAGEVLLSEHRIMTFGSEDEETRTIDFEFTLTAGEEDVHFGDTKEGTFGLRVPGWMKVDSGGTITNSAGQQNEAAWGQPADWVDYSGTHEGESVGMLVMNHPASYGFPTRWHVRTYGLFAANPFGQRGFDSSAEEGGFLLPAGESLALAYRVVLYRGAMDEERAAVLWESYRGEE